MTRVAVLLGAGASADAGIPDTAQMTRDLVAGIGSERRSSASVVTALNFVVATLNSRNTLRGGGAFDTVDVERVFSAIEALGAREDLDISAFVNTWTSDIVQVERDEEQLRLLARTLREQLGQKFPLDHQIANTLSTFVERSTGTSSGPVFRRTLTVMIDGLRKLLEPTKSVSYLRPLADLAKNQDGGLIVATLNYDLTVEKMCEAADVQCSTGIAHWADSGTWEFPDDGIRLLKLHGSIDWNLGEAVSSLGKLPQQRIYFGDQTGPGDRPAIVFGQTKLRPDGPFIELLLEFVRALDTVDHLVVVGYSFRDVHVNEQVRRWVNAKMSRTITVVDPGFSPTPWGSPPNDSFMTDLHRYLIPREPIVVPPGQAPMPPRPEEEFAPRLTVIREKATTALSQALAIA